MCNGDRKNGRSRDVGRLDEKMCLEVDEKHEERQKDDGGEEEK